MNENMTIPEALRKLADGENIPSVLYYGAMCHDATTNNDRDALRQIMFSGVTMTAAERVRDLAEEIELWGKRP